MSTSQPKYSENSSGQSYPLRSVYHNTANKDNDYANNQNGNSLIWNDNSLYQEQKSARYIKYLKDQNLQLKQQLEQERKYSSYRPPRDNSIPRINDVNQLQVQQLQLQVSTLQDEFDRYKSENTNQQKESLSQIENLLKEKQQFLKEKEKLSQENDKLNEQLDKYRTKSLDMTFGELENQLQSENEQLRAEKENNNSELEQIHSEINTALSERAKLQQKINQLKNENQKLKKSSSTPVSQQIKTIRKRSVSPRAAKAARSSTKATKKDPNEEPQEMQVRTIKKRSSTPKADKMTSTASIENLDQIRKPVLRKRSPSPKEDKDTQTNGKQTKSETVKKRSISPKDKPTSKPSETKEKSTSKRSSSPKVTSQPLEVKEKAVKRSSSPKQSDLKNKRSPLNSTDPLTKQYVDLNAQVQVLTQQLKEKSDAISRLIEKNSETKKNAEDLQAENEQLTDKCNKYINKTNIYNSTIIRQKNNLDQKDKKIEELQLKQSKIKKLIKMANKVKNTNTLLQEKNRQLEQQLIDSTMCVSMNNNNNTFSANFTETKTNFANDNNNDNNDNNNNNTTDEKMEVSRLTDKIDNLIQQMMIDSATKSQQIDELGRKISQLGATQRNLSETVGHLQSHIVETSLQGLDEISDD